MATIIINLIASLVPLVTDELALWQTAKDNLSQTSVWTPEVEAAFDAKIAAIGTAPEDQQQPL